MAKLPSISARELIKVLQKIGFKKIRQEGSHVFLQHPDGRTTVVPVHKGETIDKGLLRAILNDIKITPDELNQILKKKKFLK